MIILPLSNLISAFALVRNGVPKMRGMHSSSFMSKITKSIGYTKPATSINTSYTIPKGYIYECDVVNFALKMKRDMVIENLDLEPKISAMMRDFWNSSQWKKLSKETGSEILPSGDGSRRKTFKKIASLIANGKLK
nr:hypothetical protein [Tanacetum cinerariifolium]